MPTRVQFVDAFNFAAHLKILFDVASAKFRREAVMGHSTHVLPSEAPQLVHFVRLLDSLFAGGLSGMMPIAGSPAAESSLQLLVLCRMIRTYEAPGYSVSEYPCELYSPGDNDYRLCSLYACLRCPRECVISDVGANLLIYVSPLETLTVVANDTCRGRTITESLTRMGEPPLEREFLEQELDLSQFYED